MTGGGHAASLLVATLYTQVPAWKARIIQPRAAPWERDAGKNRTPCLPQAGGIRWTKNIIPFGRQPAAGRELQNLILGKYETIIFVRNMNFTFLNVIAPPASGRADDFPARP